MPEVNNIGNMPYYDANATQVFGRSNLGKNDFLNLLVTQLRYQDPMEPLKDSDFVAQLAQFSSLEQLDNINTSLGYSNELDYALSQTIANTMATTIIGKEIVAEGNVVYHSYGQDNDLHFTLGGEAATAEINIYNDSGALVRTLTVSDLDEGMNSVNWDGKDDADSSLPAGEYTFDVTATAADGSSVSVETRIVGIVDSVRYENGQGYLMIGDQRVSMGDIIQINMSDSSGDTTGNGDENNDNG